MGTLYLVRHGQASFGAANYDQLSPLGQRQCQRLGEHWREHGQRFDAVFTGTLQRHVQSHAAIAQGLQFEHTVQRRPALNEYDSEALIATIHSAPLERPTTPELYRHHFRLLREALKQWMAGAVQPAGMPRYADFVAGIEAVLDEVRSSAHEHVLLVSSGGPITTAVGRILGSPAEVTIDLNMRLRNSAVTEFAFTPKRHMLNSFNGVAHLDGAEHRGWVTHA